jgi:hypothetical protein
MSGRSSGASDNAAMSPNEGRFLPHVLTIGAGGAAGRRRLDAMTFDKYYWMWSEASARWLLRSSCRRLCDRASTMSPSDTGSACGWCHPSGAADEALRCIAPRDLFGGERVAATRDHPAQRYANGGGRHPVSSRRTRAP